MKKTVVTIILSMLAACACVFAFVACGGVGKGEDGSKSSGVDGDTADNGNEVTIDKSVTSIEDYRYQGYINLTSVTIPDSVTRVGSYAFDGCSSLISINIPDTVESIGEYAFDGCSSLTIYCEATSQPSGWDNMWNCSDCPVVWNCKNNDKDADGYAYTVVDGVRYRLKDGIATVIMQPSSISGAVTIPPTVIYNGSTYCVMSIEDSAFDNRRSLTSITISNSVTNIGDGAFFGCRGLMSVMIGNSVTSIGNYAFTDCRGLMSVTIGNSVTRIGREAFLQCSSLTSVTIPDSVTSIEVRAFGLCSSLTSIEIPNSVTSIERSVFYYCSSLTSIIVQSGNTKYHSAGNCLIETASKTLIAGCKNSIIPTDGSVTSIDPAAFCGCNDLTSITIPDSITSIGEQAFEDCSSLTSIKFNGTKDQWKAIRKSGWWNSRTGDYTVTCTDGTLSKSESE